MAVYVKSKRELAKAIRTKETDIVICDPSLAKNIKKFKGADITVPQAESSMAKGSLAAIGVLGGMEIVYVVGVITLGVICLYALHKDYDIIGSSPYGDLKIKRNR